MGLIKCLQTKHNFLIIRAKSKCCFTYVGPLQRSLFCGVGPDVLDTVTVFFGVALGGFIFETVSSDLVGLSGVAISVFRLTITFALFNSNFKSV